ncbi:ParB/RepB/Spo0J family partition protein [Edaphobacter dinghuensis]|uniref:Chromosome partitioning protein ParB n=1 Tax=Edaphobacter dinghuensis TaxID=1560005 RepID=A0A917H4A5_9BACT|nr:ParB/RepB/Spo0J family partition protein [Edaphobacter dinghuensis]GGG66740.1 chromosome partitioning protein ParB [Edaphobacter dinghuensis]
MATATADAKRRALGKGLESLLPARPAVVPQIAATAAVESNGKPLEIPLDQIERNPFQTRTRFDDSKLAELASSIAATGVVQPILVRPLDMPGRYQLIAGERRWLASRRVGKSTIPAIVRQVSDEQTLEITIVENLQRADLNPMEQARAYQRLSQQFHLTQEQMATRTGKERASVANFLRLLKLPETVQAKVETGELSFGHARALLSLDSAEVMASAAQKVLALSLSVRQTETYVQGLINPEAKQKKADKPEREVDPNVREAEDKLRRTLGLKVQIEDKKGKGRVIIEYSGLEDFDAILSALGGEE